MAGHRYNDRSPTESVSLIEKQDAKLDRFIDDMKPFVLRLPHKLERKRVGLWIKKLCEPPGTSPSSRKNRNLYAQLLLHMLKRGVLEDPFTRRPDAGPLQPLPSYMSIYLDEPIQTKSPSYTADDEYGRELPDWVRDLGTSTAGSVMSDTSGIAQPRIRRELPTTSGAHPIPPTRSATYTGSQERYEDFNGPTNGYRPRESLEYMNGGNHYQDADNNYSRQDEYYPPQETGYTRDYQHDGNYRTSPTVPKPYPTNGYSQFSRGVNFTTNTSYRDDLNFSKSSEREVELKVKMVEAKFHEEKLKLQQQHDVAVQKILDRKNTELEEIKSHYRNKITELESLVKKQERKVSQVTRESNALKEQKDKQITELKSLAEQTGENALNNYEKKLSDKIADFESEKIEMQKQHTNNIQELLDETNQRLQKMEEEYNQQSASTALVMQDLEARVHQLTEESEALQSSRTKLAKEKEELSDKVLTLTDELKNTKTLITKLEREKTRTMNEHQQAIQQIQRKTDSTIDLLKQEHTASSSRSSDAITDLENQVTQLKQALQESEFQRQKQIREMESSSQQEKSSMEHIYDKKCRSLQAELDQQEIDYQKRFRKMEAQLKEKDEQLQRQAQMQKQQSQQAERALNDFKDQVEKNSGKMFDEMKTQMEKVEEDLAHSKKLREKQSKEYSRQLDDMKMKHDKMIAELNIGHEQDKAQLLRSFQAERDSLLREQEQERDLQSEKLHQKMMDMEHQHKERTSRDAKAMAELEQQIRELREEVMQANSLRKTQLMELNMLREEEKQTYKRQEENLQARSKSDLDQQKLDLRRSHSSEMEQLLEKTNERLRMMEQEYSSRAEKQQETIRTLEEDMKKLREDNLRARLSSEKKFSDMTSRHNEEKSTMKKQRDNLASSLEQELQAQKTMVRHAEKRCQQIDLESQEKISRLRLQYEEKMKGLMPESVREELEDTIESLRQQISVLQSRAQVLQEELDTRNKLSMTSLSASNFNNDSYR